MLRPLIVMTLILLLSAAGAWSQGFNIVEVKVEGNKTATESLILSVADLKKGDELTATTSQEAVRRLFQLGFFRDVRLDAEEVTGGISLTISVDELPKLRKLEFTGNDKIKSKDLMERIGLSPGSYLAGYAIYESRNDILDYYGEKGYFMARVEHGLEYTEDSSAADLRFRIKEGSKVKVEQVVLTGNKEVEASDIVGKMRNRKRGWLRTSDFDKEAYAEDKEKIIDYLHQKGYIDAYLKSDSIAIDSTINKMTIYLDIYEGPRYYFGETSWNGNEVCSDEMLDGVLKYSRGDIFDIEKFDESLYEIYFLYQEKGYLHVRVTDERTTRDSLIDIAFDIVEGVPSEVNLVRIIGNTRTHENVIRREMILRPGQVFHRSLLLRSIRDIMQLNYFGNVVPDIVDLPSGDVDVVVKVEEKPTAQVSAGAGYSGRDKFVGTFGLGIPNFRGKGQQLTMNVDIGSRRDSYSLSFTEPWAFSTPTLMGIDLYYTNRNWYDEFIEGRRGGSFRVGRRLRWPDSYFRVYARYRLEGARYYDFSDGYVLNNSEITWMSYLKGDDTVRTATVGDPLEGSLLDYNETWNTASSVQLSIVRDSRDLPEFATRGSTMSYSIEESGGLLGGYWRYRKHLISGSKFYPLFWGIAIAGKITYGAVTSPDNDSTILEFDRFAVGGTGYSGVIRGYDEGSLTPDSMIVREEQLVWYSDSTRTQLDSITVYTDPRATSVRGKYMLVGNLELQIPFIANQLYGLVFFDIGNSWLDVEDIKFNDLYKGVGLGFRLVVPGIGTIGFDFGYALERQYSPDGEDILQDRGWKPHFQIGTIFR